LKISIITINYNNSLGLEKTIESVISQTYSNIEYIIIDGGSTDGSVEVIKKHETKIAYWVSEKDDGVYNAMNKGVLRATGEYLLMLNSGDYLVNDNIVKSVINSGLDADIVYGNVVWKTTDSEYLGSFPDELNFNYFINNSIGHQATFIHHKLHEIVGIYDVNFKIVSDWKLIMLAIIRHQLSYKHLPIALSVCDRNGLSCLPENWDTIVNERQEVLENNFKYFLKDYEYFNEIERKYLLMKNARHYKFISKLKFLVNKING
jgi:glycosyltransferase involved in cell wall biosynthesis